VGFVHESPRRAQLVNRFRTHVPPLPPVDGAPRPPSRLEVFGVGPTWLQLTWSALGPGPVTVRAGDVALDLRADGGPGAVVLDGLAPGRPCEVVLDGEGVPGGPVRLAGRTLTPPPGEVLHRIATVSDVHLGSTATGYLHTMVEKPEPADPHPLRCARAAVAESRAWGADELVVKGDLVEQSDPALWAQAAEVLDGFAGAVHVVPGNHERARRGDADPVGGLAPHGRRVTTPIGHHDVPGIRVVLCDTTVAGHDVGHVRTLVDEVVGLAAGAGGPVLLALHHQLMRWPVDVPVGIRPAENRRLLDALAAANPHVLVTSGHTHRHRRRHHGPITITEVGSTKDFPGTWAGYEVHEGGIVQTVRRIAEPSAIRWTDHTRRAAGGLWSRWAPGRLGDRCFTRTW